MSTFLDRYPVSIGTQRVELPLVPLHETAAIALLMTIDRGIGFMATAGEDLAALISHLAPDIIATNATLGIPVAIEVSRALGLDDYLVLQKTAKIHLGDALTEPLRSITTDSDQVLRLDRSRLEGLAGRRVVLVDDVIASGGSIAAAIALLRRGGAEVVGVGAVPKRAFTAHSRPSANVACP